MMPLLYWEDSGGDDVVTGDDGGERLTESQERCLYPIKYIKYIEP